jgi:hypothetical protein
MQSTRSREQRQISKDHLRAKLGYQWKAIFKNLVKQDTKGTGFVDRFNFEKSCDLYGARLAKDDMNKLVAYYANIDKMIDYNLLSRDLGLNRPELDIFANTNRRAVAS